MEMSGFESAVVDAAEMRGVGRREGFGQPLSKLICFFDDIATILEWKLEEKEKEKLLIWRSEDIRDLEANIEVGRKREGAGLIGGEKFLCSSVRSGAEIDNNSMLCVPFLYYLHFRDHVHRQMDSEMVFEVFIR
jgi:hypothetical protein